MIFSRASTACSAYLTYTLKAMLRSLYSLQPSVAIWHGAAQCSLLLHRTIDITHRQSAGLLYHPELRKSFKGAMLQRCVAQCSSPPYTPP